MAGKHADFAASKAATWSWCKGAIPLWISRGRPQGKSSYDSAAGTCTHSIAERYATGKPLPTVGSSEDHDGFVIKCDGERIARACNYVDAVNSMPGVKFWELPLDMSKWLHVADQFGTSDCARFDLEALHLAAHDLKDGVGKVYAKDNDQLLCYLISAWEELSYLGIPVTFSVHIHQPRIEWYDKHEYTLEEVVAHAKRLAAAATRGADLATENNPKRILAALDASNPKACQWCPNAGDCPAKHAAVAADFPIIQQGSPALPPVSSLTNEQLGQLLDKEQMIEKAFKSWREEATRRAEGGQQIPGWCIGVGRQGNRKWRDAKAENEVSDVIYEAIENAAYTRELISPTEAERRLKKDHPETWAAVQAFIHRDPGKPTLLPMIDAAGRALPIPEFQDISQ